MCTIIAGCSFDIRRWFQTSEPQLVTFHEAPTKEQLVAHINQRAGRLLGWRSNDISISMTGPEGMTMSPSAVMAVQAPRNFRMIVSLFSINQADFGSNSDRFWFWMRNSKPKNVFTARHEDIPQIQKKLPIPFQPEWLMEALGVVPMDERSVNLYYEDQQGQKAVLSSRQTLPDGRTVTQVVRVDARSGHITERILQNSAGEIIARAEFQNYKPIEKSGIWMPHRIGLHWPKTKSMMTLSLGTIEVNPVIPESLWQVPKYDSAPPLDLSAVMNQRNGISTPPADLRRLRKTLPEVRPRFDDEQPPGVNPSPQPRGHVAPLQTPITDSSAPPFPGGRGPTGRVKIQPVSSNDITEMGRPKFDDD